MPRRLLPEPSLGQPQILECILSPGEILSCPSAACTSSKRSRSRRPYLSPTLPSTTTTTRASTRPIKACKVAVSRRDDHAGDSLLLHQHHPRTGSSLLSEALEFTGIAGKPREYFEPDYEKDWSFAWASRRMPTTSKSSWRRARRPTASSAPRSTGISLSHLGAKLRSMGAAAYPISSICGAPSPT